MPLTAAAMRATLATRATTGLHVRAGLSLGGRKAREAIRIMVTKPERGAFAHGDTFMSDAAEQLSHAFAWPTELITADRFTTDEIAQAGLVRQATFRQSSDPEVAVASSARKYQGSMAEGEQ